MNRLGQRSYDDLLEHLQKDPEGLTKLTTEQEKVLVRLNYAYSNMFIHNSPEKVANMIQKEYGVSRSTSYNDISFAFKLFGRANIIDETGEILWYENALKLRKKCMEELDLAAAARTEESIRKFLDSRASRQKDFDPSKFSVVTINISCKPEDIGLKSYTDEEIEKLRQEVYQRRKTIELSQNGSGTYEKT